MVQEQVRALAQKAALAPSLTIDVISDPAEFLRLGEAWDRLVSLSGITQPYMSHAWLVSWWQSFGGSDELRIFIVKSEGEWVAAAPMMIRSTKMYGFPVRRLEVLYNHHTPRYEFPVRDRSEEVYRALWRAMSSPQGDWDAVVLQQFRDDSPTLSVFEKFAQQQGWRAGRWVPEPSPFIRLDCDYETLINRLSHKERHNLRRRYAKLSELGEVEMEVISRRADVAAAMADGLRIEAAAWKGRAGTAMICDPRVQQFYVDLAERAADLGWLRLTFLRVGGRRIAFHYVLETGGVVHGMKMGYDPEYHVYSPGHTLLSLILQKACREGAREFDFQGTNDGWKLVWTKDGRTNPWLFMFRDSVRGRLLHQAKFVVLPAFRRRERLLRLAQHAKHLLGLGNLCFLSSE